MREVARQRQPDLTVVLENVHDPHNVSAVLRSCDAVGIPKIYLIHTDPRLQDIGYQPGHRSSAGTRKWVEVEVFHRIEEAIAALRTTYDALWCSALGDASSDVYDLTLTGSVALIFGNEHSGVSVELSEACDGHFSIPQVGMVQSLNISVACAVTLYEAFRQRRSEGGYDKSLDTARTELFQTYQDIHDKKVSFLPDDDTAT